MPHCHGLARWTDVYLSAHLWRQYITGTRLLQTLMRHYFLLPPTGPVAPLARGVFTPSLSLALVALTTTAQRRATPLLAALVRAVPLAVIAV